MNIKELCALGQYPFNTNDTKSADLYQKEEHEIFMKKCMEYVIYLAKKAFFLLKGPMQQFKIFKRKKYAKLTTNLLNSLY